MPRLLYRGLAAAIALGLAAAASVAWAAGSGGGGSGGGGGGSGANPITTTCVNDTWYCTAWSTCTAEGNQNRTCSLSFDCPNADDPRPAETQRCTPLCTADTWICGEWSTCIADGTQSRTCTLEIDCPTAATPQPATTQTCTPPPQPIPATAPMARPTPPPAPKVRPTPLPTPIPSPRPTGPLCNDLTTLVERVRCRLTLPEAELERQQALQYLPEECRPIGDGTTQQQCVELYRKLQACWGFPVGPQRIDCVKKIIKLGDVTTEATACGQLPTNEIADCRNMLRSRVYSLIKFRFYDLEERAEDLRERGAPLDAVANFVAATEEAKQRFNLATTKEQRRAIILEVRAAWQKFIVAITPKLRPTSVK